MMDFSDLEAFECRLDGGVFELILNRPDHGNCFGEVFCGELHRIFNEISERHEVRAVLISSRGRFFSVGGDIDLMAGNEDDRPALLKALTSPLHMAITRMMLMNAPIICAVQGGGAFGGAVAFAAAADVVIAGRATRFGSAFTGIGFSCDSGTTISITNRMGLSRAKRFVLLGEILPAESALAAGLVDQLADDAVLHQEASAVAHRLAAGPTSAYGEIKRLFVQSAGMGVASQMEHEAVAMARNSRTHDANEGLKAFIEKRKPQFTGG